jgi:acetylornithine deacetylase
MPHNPTLETGIIDAVDTLADDLFAFIQQLVRIPSLPGDEAPAHVLVARKLESLHLDVQMVSSTREALASHPAFCDDGIPVEQRINVVGRWRGRSRDPSGQPHGPRSLILNGHVDVVSPGNVALWHESPWSGAIRDGKLFGRGACDMKAGLSAAIFAIEAVQRAGVALQQDVLLESVSGEETGGLGTLTTIVNGYRADAAIVLEPTALRVSVVQSGALTFRLRVPGRSVHACMKPLGVSAIAKVPAILEALDSLERQRHAGYHNPLYANPMNVAPISVGTIHGGDWPSTVPGAAVLEGRYGVLPGESLDAARRALSEAVQAAAAADTWLCDHPPVLEWFEGQFESGATDPAEPIVGVLRDAHHEITRRAAVLEGVTYGSDLRLFTNHARMPAVLYGPGNIEQAHAANEWVDLQQVLEGTKVLAVTLHRWCGGVAA